MNDNSRHIELIAGTADSHSSVKSVELEPYHPLGLRKYKNLGVDAAFRHEKKLAPEKLTELLTELRKLTKKTAFCDAE